MGADWLPESRLSLRPRVQIAPAGEERWQVRWDFDEVVFLRGTSAGRVLPWLAPLLDTRPVLAQVQRIAAEHGQTDDLGHVLGWLREQRLVQADVIEETDRSGAELARAIESLGVDAATILMGLAEMPVVVLGRSHLAKQLVGSLRSQGFAASIIEPGTEAPMGPLTVAIETDCSPGTLERLNRTSLNERRPWMLVGAWNLRLLVGPIFVPGQTACYECYRRRLDSHRAHLEAWRAAEAWRLTHPAPPCPEPVLPAMADLAAAHGALELFHFVTDLRLARTVGSVLIYSPRDARLSVESVLRVPWCVVCSVDRQSNQGQ